MCDCTDRQRSLPNWNRATIDAGSRDFGACNENDVGAGAERASGSFGTVGPSSSGFAPT